MRLDMRMPEKSSPKNLIDARIRPYDTLTEIRMVSFYNILSEKEKRLYAGGPGPSI